jgi:hypothetical protein
MSGGPPTYVCITDISVRLPIFYFLRDQGVIRLTLRVLGLVRTLLLGTFVDCSYGKDFFFNKKVCFYRGITKTKLEELV